MPDGSLSLPARLYLLAWDPRKARVAAADRVPHLVRAGALVDLARRGLLLDQGGIATPADLDARTGDAVLDGLLELVRESVPHRWRSWVPLRARVTLDAVREQLTAEGYLRAEKRRALGVFPTVEYVVARTAAAERLQTEIRAVAQGAAPAAGISARDAAVAALATAAGLPTVTPAEDRAGHARRVAELVKAACAPDPGLRDIFREVLPVLSATGMPSGG